MLSYKQGLAYARPGPLPLPRLTLFRLESGTGMRDCLDLHVRNQGRGEDGVWPRAHLGAPREIVGTWRRGSVIHFSI